MITKAKIFAAFDRFDAGERPSSYREPKCWFVQGNSSKLYPLKLIYSLATECSPMSFHTNKAKRELKNLGFIIVNAMIADDIENNFEDAVCQALTEPDQRRQRLSTASTYAQEQFVIQRIFKRNPDVVAEARSRANGICQVCKKPAPFFKKSNTEPYLEVHHIKQLADGGEDSVENTIAVCPNCHRQAHYG